MVDGHWATDGKRAGIPVKGSFLALTLRESIEYSANRHISLDIIRTTIPL